MLATVMPEIVIRSVDDWVAVYKNGRKVWENHSCGIHEGLEALGIPFENIDLDADYDEGCDPLTFFPETL